jgi:hypothetical protein
LEFYTRDREGKTCRERSGAVSKKKRKINDVLPNDFILVRIQELENKIKVLKAVSSKPLERKRTKIGNVYVETVKIKD